MKGLILPVDMVAERFRGVLRISKIFRFLVENRSIGIIGIAVWWAFLGVIC